MRLRPSGLPGLLGLLLLTPLPAQDPPPGPADAPAAAIPRLPVLRLLVLLKNAAAMSILDVTRGEEVARVAVGDGPHEVAVAPDGRTAVVCNYGGRTPGSTLSVIDVPTAKVLRTIDLLVGDGERRHLRPHGIAFDAAGRHVWVTSEASRSLLRVDLEAGKVLAAIPTQQGLSHMVALAADGGHAYTASIRDGSLAAFRLGDDPKLDGPLRVIPTGAGAEGLAVQPGTGLVWVSNREADTVSIVDPKDLRVVDTLATGSFPIRVAFPPDGRLALVTCANDGTLLAFDAASRERKWSVSLATEAVPAPTPVGVIADAAGGLAYVACTRSDELAVVDLATGKVVRRIATGREPDGMAWASFVF